MRPSHGLTPVPSGLASQRRHSDSAAQIFKGHNDVDLQSIQMLQEIAPTLDKDVLIEILKGNNFDLDRSTDAALALMVSLSAEEGTPVLSSPSPPATTQINKLRESRRSLPNLSRSVVSHALQTSDAQSQSFHEPGLSNPSISPVANPTSIPSNSNNHGDELIEKKGDGMGEEPPRQLKRGVAMVLPPDFIVSPRFRVSIDRQTEDSMEFSILFFRRKKKLGITIQEQDGEISIQEIHGDADSTSSFLARDAGVRLGDILAGINSEYFSPGAEVQDVIDLLSMAGDFVTIHFLRRFGVDGGDVGARFHPFARILEDQGVIMEERIGYVSKALSRLKDRVLQWDSGWIVQRMEKWQIARLATGSSPRQVGPFDFSFSLGGATTTASPSASTFLGKKSDLVVSTRNLRPALSIRIMRAEERRNHVVYVILVIDIRTSSEWVVHRRFREFNEFREVRSCILQRNFTI